jgi:hypothetical protein
MCLAPTDAIIWQLSVIKATIKGLNEDPALAFAMLEKADVTIRVHPPADARYPKSYELILHDGLVDSETGSARIGVRIRGELQAEQDAPDHLKLRPTSALLESKVDDEPWCQVSGKARDSSGDLHTENYGAQALRYARCFYYVPDERH